jgi:hypothetical protein
MKKQMVMIGIIILVLLGMIGFSGCFEATKSIFTGKFLTMRDIYSFNCDAEGEFLTSSNETITIYITGDWEQIQLNRTMRVSTEYSGGYILLYYDYLEEK